jgi:hypothetical protein
MFLKITDNIFIVSSHTYCVTRLGVLPDSFCSEIILYVVLCRKQHSLNWTNKGHIRKVEDRSVKSI